MNSSPGTSVPGRSSERGSAIAYWMLGLLVTIYVGATTDFRDEIQTTDGWEHHRAVRVMAEVGFHPGNPTYATEEPSIRYSPYTVALALVSRWARWNPWHVLSGAAVLNSAALVLALYTLLCTFGRRGTALPVLVILLFLYGTNPGYANSLAFEDLPVHQLNPSAFALPLCLVAWAAWRSLCMSKCRLVVAAPIVIVALAIALLSHAMTGLLGLLGLAAVSLSADSSRGRVLLAAGAVVTIVLAICCLWPYYPFVQAVLRNPNPGYWYNPYILRLMLTNWCLPAMLASLLAMPYRREPLVRFAMWGLFATLMLTALAAASRSPTFARLPLAGLIFAQVLTGAVLHHWELSRASSWRDILSRLRSLSPDAFIPGFVRALLPALLLYFGVPQLVDAIRQPHLLRPILAKWLQVDDRRAHWFQQYQAVLAPVGERDVVMAESSTGWPVPSFRGRIVAAEHFELFTPDQQRRFDDVQVFMAPGTRQATRVQLIQRYGVSWILLDRRANASVLPELLVANAIAREAGRLILIDAARWCEAVAVPTVPK